MSVQKGEGPAQTRQKVGTEPLGTGHQLGQGLRVPEKPQWLLECQLGHDSPQRDPQGSRRVTGTL